MTRTEHLLTILAEECAEVAQRVSKALRFGVREVQPGQALTNADRVVNEFTDMLAAYEMLHEDAILAPRMFTVDRFARELIEAKKEKVERFLAFSAGRGLVDGIPADPTAPHPETAGVMYAPKCSGPDLRVGGRPECPAILTEGLDGAEMAYCPGCGYCSHPSTSAKDGYWHCNACNKNLGPLSPVVRG